MLKGRGAIGDSNCVTPTCRIRVIDLMEEYRKKEFSLALWYTLYNLVFSYAVLFVHLSIYKYLYIYQSICIYVSVCVSRNVNLKSTCNISHSNVFGILLDCLWAPWLYFLAGSQSLRNIWVKTTRMGTGLSLPRLLTELMVYNMPYTWVIWNICHVIYQNTDSIGVLTKTDGVSYFSKRNLCVQSQ